ncbi:MAG: C4-dicarboxylic acid transporter DauA [Gammaproteobacteria bacterium]|nr:C4-dicarboxylic acid transporter DauA [Gammaproteobacteria bacterium]
MRDNRFHSISNGGIARALRESWREFDGRLPWRADLLAGLTVGVVAVPLAMALAIASGVPPQYGLYTAAIAGVFIALTGGSRVSVSGPTAAFVVILHPIAVQYGLGGLVMASLLAGFLLLAMGLGRLGQLVQYIPYPVTTGFTTGIAVVIASLQLKDFFGLEISTPSDHFFERVIVLWQALPSLSWRDSAIGVLTLAVLIAWRWLPTRVPGHLVALGLATVIAWGMSNAMGDFQVANIASRFSYVVGDHIMHGIPSVPPAWGWPWDLPGRDGQPIELSWHLLRELAGPALAIALLGAIESLLCAVVADGMAGTKHDPDSELIGQGIGNIIAPFFGGFAATGAIARTATNIRAGARTPVAAIVHALVVLAAILVLTPILNMLPMAALAGLLLMVAWNMAEVKHFAFILRVAPREDVLVLLTCFSLTVVFDMVIAIAVGMVLASLLFIKRMVEVSSVELAASAHTTHGNIGLPSGVRIYDVAGPLFFGAAEKALATLTEIDASTKGVILQLQAVPVMDVTGLVALESMIKNLRKHAIRVALVGVQEQPLALLHRAAPEWESALEFFTTVDDAVAAFTQICSKK